MTVPWSAHKDGCQANAGTLGELPTPIVVPARTVQSIGSTTAPGCGVRFAAQRDSNPCRHLEGVEGIAHWVLKRIVLPGQRLAPVVAASGLDGHSSALSWHHRSAHRGGSIAHQEGDHVGDRRRLDGSSQHPRWEHGLIPFRGDDPRRDGADPDAPWMKLRIECLAVDDRTTHRSKAAHGNLRRARGQRVLAGCPSRARTDYEETSSPSTCQSAQRISRHVANRNGVSARGRRERARNLELSDPRRQLCHSACKAMGTDLLPVRIDLDPL